MITRRTLWLQVLKVMETSEKAEAEAADVMVFRIIAKQELLAVAEIPGADEELMVYILRLT